MKLVFKILCVFLLAVCVNPLLADFNFQEKWSMELDGPSSRYGDFWTNEDGNHFFLLSHNRCVFLVEDGSVFWQSDTLDGGITALRAIDFGAGDGVEIVANSPSWYRSILHYFSGENFEHETSVEFLVMVEPDDNPPNWESDYSNVTDIVVLPEALPDESKNIIYGNSAWEGFDGWDDDPTTIYSGMIGQVDISGDEGRRLFGSGRIRNIEVVDINDDQTSELVVGYDYYRNQTWSQAPGCCEAGEERCGVALVYPNIRSERLNLYEDQWDYLEENWQRHPGAFYKALTVQPPDSEMKIYAHYRDTSGVKLARISLPDLELEEEIIVPTGIIAKYLDSHILLLTPEGDLNVISLDEFEITEVVEGFVENPIDIQIGQFDDDWQQEIAVLTDSAFTLYDFTPLAALDENIIVPVDCYLLSAYPNPFNSMTRLKYNMQSPGDCHLTVYDMAGNTIYHHTLKNQQAGELSISMDASELTSGVYIARITSGNITSATKLVVLE